MNDSVMKKAIGWYQWSKWLDNGLLLWLMKGELESGLYYDNLTHTNYSKFKMHFMGNFFCGEHCKAITKIKMKIFIERQIEKYIFNVLNANGRNATKS